MRQHEFILLFRGVAVWPLAALAQQPAKLPTIGFLGSATASAWTNWVAAFVQRLRERRWIQGSTIAKSGFPWNRLNIPDELGRVRDRSSI